MNFKPLLIALTCSTLLMSQSTIAFSGIGNSLTKTGEEYKTAFNYNDKECKRWGFNGGFIKIKGSKYCAYLKDIKSEKLKPKNSNVKSTTTSKTDWLRCGKNNISCTTSHASGESNCINSSSSTTNSVTVGATAEAELVKDVFGLSVSGSASRSWTETKGQSSCMTKDLRISCTVKPGFKVRLQHNVITQRFKGNAILTGYKMRQKRILYVNSYTGKKSSELVGDWKGYNKTSANIFGGVETTLPVRRNAICKSEKN